MWISDHMRKDLYAAYRTNSAGKGLYLPVEEKVTNRLLSEHIAGEKPIGQYLLLPPERNTVRVAVIDIDDKKRQKDWKDLCGIAAHICDTLGSAYAPWVCRSGSGHGIHIWFFWPSPQRAVYVRQALRPVVDKMRVKYDVSIDLFPAQDEAAQLGNLVAVPFSRKSRYITNLGTGDVHSDLSTWEGPLPRYSADLYEQQIMDLDSLIEDAGKGLPSENDVAYGPVDIPTIKEALSFVSNDDYAVWIRVGLALKTAAGSGQLTDEEGKEIWDSWSKNSPKYDAWRINYDWNRFNERRSGVTLGTVWHYAYRGGWKGPAPSAVANDTPSEAPSPPVMSAAQGQNKNPTSSGGSENIQEVNRDHFVAREGSKYFIFKEVLDDDFKRQSVVRLTKQDFLIELANKMELSYTKTGRLSSEPLAEAWLKSPHRRQYESIVFNPEGAPENTYNLWRGFTVKPSSEGSCELFKEHVLNNICRGDENVYNYVMNWCAFTIQFPGTPIGTALVLRGGQGTGKGTLAKVIGNLFGQHFIHASNKNTVFGRFNACLHDCILLFLDEAYWAGAKAEQSTLKALITEPTLQIEGKNRDTITTKNMVHTIIATNNDWSVPTDLDDRRFLTLHVADTRARDYTYFNALYDQLKRGGYSRLLYELQQRQVSEFQPAAIPGTPELWVQKRNSLSSIGEWWLERLQQGTPGSSIKDWDVAVPVTAMYHDYVDYCELAKIRSTGTSTWFMRKLSEMIQHREIADRRTLTEGIVTRKGVLEPGTRQVFWRLPSLKECREIFALQAKAEIIWDSIPETVAQKKRRESDEILI